MRKVFIDCGFYRGKAIKIFKKTKEYDKEFEIIAFEASDLKKEKIENLKAVGIQLINKAVWIYDGKIDFFSSSRRRGQANSIYPNPVKPKSEVKREIESVDFSKWIMKNFSREDFIVLKLDVEGAEYKILNKMIEDGSIDYIDILYSEYHYERAKSEATIEEFSNLRKKINEYDLEVRTAIEWYYAKTKNG
jgi:FkbM family methyltransferase